MAGGITVYGVTWCPDCKRVKKLLGEHQIPGHGSILMGTSMPCICRKSQTAENIPFLPCSSPTAAYSLSRPMPKGTPMQFPQ